VNDKRGDPVFQNVVVPLLAVLVIMPIDILMHRVDCINNSSVGFYLRCSLDGL